MENELQILMNNYNCIDNSFVHKLSEELVFDFQLFWDYYNSVRVITKETFDKPLNREISRAISFTHAKILENIIWEYSDNNVGQTENFPFNKLHLIIERLSFLVDGYFQGYLIEESNFDEDLINPLFNERAELEASIIQLGFFKAGLDIHALGFKADDGTYDIYLNEEDDNFWLIQS
ncbi:Imm41 family immunity protein [Paenibacillus gorillae]|uniref:Imm41 family immunity protein n=1 Tax=Paenibacillus gorillae TaxID=1243662 RepID=UPI0005A7DACC|nr:Imm41 family immunity protein [Paenibacillus gorillae]